MKSLLLQLLTLVGYLLSPAWSRPVVRSIRSAHEFDRLLEKHATKTGLPVVVDFYSDSCGPCRMMAPIFKQAAASYKDKAVFVKIDTNAQRELSARYQIRSLPTFMWFLNGKKVHEAKGGIGDGPLRQQTDQLIRQAEIENVQLTLESLTTYYNTVDPNKPQEDIQSVFQKCLDMSKQKKNSDACYGQAVNQLTRKLKKKYSQAPQTSVRFTPEDAASSSENDQQQQQQSKEKNTKPKDKKTSSGPNLHLATKEQLQAELEKRLDEERDAEVEQEEDDDDDQMELNRWVPGDFPERVVIIGGGPAGMAAAIYAARAGLSPLVIAPSMGGQLQGKGVDVENYPGLHNVTGPTVIAYMREQAASFGALFEDDFVTGITATQRPLLVHTNATGTIETHSIIVATGAESNWLGIPGEYELRGGGVSSCATCDGFLYANQNVIVVGGGDTAMEDALVLARTSKSVTVIHRRDTFRASKVLAQRVLEHPLITVQWNTVVEKIIGKTLETPDNNDNDDSSDSVDLDIEIPMVVSGAILKDVETGEIRQVDCDAVFVAIGHTPSTSFLDGIVEFDPNHNGYVQTIGTSTKTSVPGIFAAGDVSDAIYRQAITSAGSGAAAALDAERYLSEEGLGNEAAELEAELMAEIMGTRSNNNNGLQQEESLGYNVYEDAGGRMQGMKESIAAEL